jgi:hypothetical protein
MGPALTKAFVQEALMTAILEHPNVVPVYDFSIGSDGQPILAMRWIRGRRWDIQICADATMPRADYLDKHLPTLISVAQAVAYAHSKGIIHRDLKPSQVMIGEFGEVYLMDWGLAMVVDEDVFFKLHPELRDSVIPKKSGDIPLGATPKFMAPEQASSDLNQLGLFTDVFLLGATMYYLLTGRAPREDSQARLDFTTLRKEQILAPNAVADDLDVPEELSRICMKALSPDPTKRHATAKEFLSELVAYQSGASKRRDSEAITARASALLCVDRRDYAVLSDCENLLNRAIGLWPGNRQADQLRQEVLLEFATLALDSGDLMLARVLALRLEPGETREEILNEVNANQQLTLLAEQEALDAERRIQELSKSSEMIERRVVDLEVKLAQSQRVTRWVLTALRSVLGAAESMDRDALLAAGGDLLSQPFEPGLRGNSELRELVARLGQVLTSRGLTSLAAKANQRLKEIG